MKNLINKAHDILLIIALIMILAFSISLSLFNLQITLVVMTIIAGIIVLLGALTFIKMILEKADLIIESELNYFKNNI